MHRACQTAAANPPAPENHNRPQELRGDLGLNPANLPLDEQAAGAFPFLTPRDFTDRIQPGDPDDPLLRQIWPDPRESAPQPPGFHTDPVADRDAVATPGLLRKYRGRALLITTGACAIHCRYCFRRHFPYREHRSDSEPWAGALAHLRRDSAIEELILSGGDPLTLSTPRLADLIGAVAAIPHIRRIRIHSRVPVVAPGRMTPELAALLTVQTKAVVLVIHANHAAELDEAVAAHLAPLAGRVTLLNQAVLLRGVNDSVDALCGLSERLFACGALPYYLHQLDPVAGAAHFEVPDDTARRLHRAMRARLPGYLVPRLVRERPGADAKVPLPP